ncbi:NYN domain-containing protein, partial [Acinetobacter baumannii]
LPLKKRGSFEMEKGIDVWLALEALEQSYYKHYDFVVLLAGDGDYLPLLRKLNAFGIRVMLLFWEFEYEDDRGGVRY